QHAFRAQAEHEQLEKPALDRPGQHLRRAQGLARLGGERLEQLGRRRRVCGRVVLDLVRNDHVEADAWVRGASISLPSLIRLALSFDSSRYAAPSSNSTHGTRFCPVRLTVSGREPNHFSFTTSYSIPASSSACCTFQHGCGPLTHRFVQR